MNMNITDTTTTITISDYRNYKSRTCNNGGDYGFDIIIRRLDKDLWRIFHYTTADFSYSVKYGGFTTCDETDDEKFPWMDFSTEEVTKLLNDYIEIQNEFQKTSFNKEGYFEIKII